LLAARGATETVEERLHCRAGRHLALLLPSDSVGEREQPTVSLPSLRNLREDVAKVIFVVAANPADVGSLSKLKI
jgi:hypothetical protein